MSTKDSKVLHSSLCEICDKEPASEIQGGVIKGQRKIWFCCRICKQNIIDERTNGRDRREIS